MELQRKLSIVREYMREQGTEGLLIRRQPNFSWLTGGGRGFIGLASETACGSLVVTQEKCFLVANNIESGRLAVEELPSGVIEVVSIPWEQDGTLLSVVRELCPNGYIDDTQANAFFVQHRTALDEEEQERFRALGRDVDRCMWEAMYNVEPGITEFEMAGRLSAALWSAGIEPITMLIAADDRSCHVRHYVPTAKAAERGLICSICARYGGLIASATRSVAFTPDFATDYEELLHVETAAFAATVPGATLGEVFGTICKAYEAAGMPREWENHHQGGLTGYAAREIRADRTTSHVVRLHEAYAWNPSCIGAKCEDTVLVTESGVEILTAGTWPTCEVDGYARPQILKRY